VGALGSNGEALERSGDRAPTHRYCEARSASACGSAAGAYGAPPRRGPEPGSAPPRRPAGGRTG